MKKINILFVFFAVIIIFAPNSYGLTINYNGADPNTIFGSSNDSPSSTVITYLQNTYRASDTVKLINGVGITNEVESWFAGGATSIILEEIAGYATRTTFGWYNVITNESSQIFTGAQSVGANSTIIFDPAITFGFYINPNGVVGNRMYTENTKNTHNDYQVTIFQVNNSNEYILGWEDLDLNGSTGGDRDYQDMIVRVTINPVPEPATTFLIGMGVTGLAAVGRRRKKA